MEAMEAMEVTDEVVLPWGVTCNPSPQASLPRQQLTCTIHMSSISWILYHIPSHHLPQTHHFDQKMPTEGVYISPEGKKKFIPLENNPEVFTSLVHDLGVSDELEFHDIYSLDSEMLGFIPRPALALIFISPPPMYTTVRAADGTRSAKDGITYDKSGDEEPAVWYRQLVGNACGLIALLHSVSNGEARNFIRDDSILDKLIKQVTPLKPLDRAQVVYDSEALEEAHMRHARRGDTSAPNAEQTAAHHFLAFVKGKDGHLWEMEGSSDGPIDRGLLKDDEDMLSEVALEKGVRRHLNAANGELDFSIIALVKRPTE